jgi:hypothetical protein
MIEKSNSTSLTLATIAILGQPPSPLSLTIFYEFKKYRKALIRLAFTLRKAKNLKKYPPANKNGAISHQSG